MAEVTESRQSRGLELRYRFRVEPDGLRLDPLVNCTKRLTGSWPDPAAARAGIHAVDVAERVVGILGFHPPRLEGVSY
jgi:hypothetical protein